MALGEKGPTEGLDAAAARRGDGYAVKLWRRRGPKRQIGRRLLPILIVSDQSQHHAEARFGEKASILRVCDLPYFSEDWGWNVGLLEESDGAFARDPRPRSHYRPVRRDESRPTSLEG